MTVDMRAIDRRASRARAAGVPVTITHDEAWDAAERITEGDENPTAAAITYHDLLRSSALHQLRVFGHVARIRPIRAFRSKR